MPNKGDTAWMLTSTALVLLMSVPALALFYGGLVRTKNMLSVLMQVFVGFSLITVLWCVYGYSLAFTQGNAVHRRPQPAVPRTARSTPRPAPSRSPRPSASNTPLYELVYVAFQATFAAITCCLILGSLVERIKFSAVLLFLVIWFTFSYCPVAHMVWFWAGPDAYTSADRRTRLSATGGLIWQWGALDFAGGTVVHINAGVAGLVGAIVLGKRIGFGKEPMAPHSLTMTMIGASLLWFGWFGFNAGSALEANGSRRARLHEHLPRHRLRGAVVDVRRVAGQGQALDARARPRARSPGSWRSRPRPATSASRAPSSSASVPAWCACGASRD